jgi:hypothetical protein
MKSITHTKKTTAVNILSKVVIIFVLGGMGIAETAFGGDTLDAANATIAAATASSKAAQEKSDCQQMRNDLKEANKQISDACRRAGAGGNDSCFKAAVECGKTAGEDNFSSMTGLLSQMSGNPVIQSMASSMGGSGLNTSCPQISGQDYFTERKNITDDIESAKEDLAKLNDERATVQDDFNKEIQDIQDALKKAQEELAKAKLELKDKKRKQLADFQNQQNQMQEELRKKGTDVLGLQGQLIQSQQDHALKLISMSDASGKRACMKAVLDAKKAYEAIGSSQSSNYIGEAKKKKAELIATYNDCIDSFLQQRSALNKSKKQEQDQIKKAVTDAQQFIEELNNSLSTAANQLAEIQADAKTEEDNETLKVTQLMQTSQTKMLAAQQKMQTNMTTITAKDQNLNQKLNRLNNELTTLGPAPTKSRSADYSVSDASSDISGGVNDALDIIDSEDFKKCQSGKESSNRSKYKDFQQNSGVN